MESMNPTTKNSVIIITILTVLLPVLFFGVILVFNVTGLPLYFSQLVLYGAFYLLAIWGMKRSNIRLAWNQRIIWNSLLVLALSWLIYVAVISLTGVIRLPLELQALRSTPLWNILARIVSAWLFVGLAEEVLFRGFFLKKFLSFYEGRQSAHPTLLAVVVSSAFFSLWHLPVRLFSLFNGELSVGLLLLSLVVLFAMGAVFAWLYLRSGSILLTGLVHGLVDYPLLGGNSQLGFFILILAIGLVEVTRLIGTKKGRPIQI